MSGQPDPLSLSFTDVLTCVFGAAIALFLIFIAIVSLDATQGSVEGQLQGYSTQRMKSIQEKVIAGYAPVTIRIVSENQGILKYLDLPELRDARPQEFIQITRQGTPPLYGIVIQSQKGFKGKTTALSLRQGTLPEKIISFPTEIYVTTIVGGIAHSDTKIVNQQIIASDNKQLFIFGPRVVRFMKKVSR